MKRMVQQLDNINIAGKEKLVTPQELKDALPLSNKGSLVVAEGREKIKKIIDGHDPRHLLIVGPCSIHDVACGIEYAKRLTALAEEVSDSIVLVMRVYFEKPRTTVGWKGLINDPHLNESFNINEGLHIGRRFLVEVADLGMPTASEALDPITPQYLQDCLSWSAIGARTTESQTHRELASGLSTAIGFKNGTNGDLMTAVNALKSVSSAHHFLGISQEGQVSIIHSSGNPYAHIVLRGGDKLQNFDSVSVSMCGETLKKAGLAPAIMIDCSHANSKKQHKLQPLVFSDVVSQIIDGNTAIIGTMLESNIHSGNQVFTGSAASDLVYGVSITDACINWETTEKIIRESAKRLQPSIESRRKD